GEQGVDQSLRGSQGEGCDLERCRLPGVARRGQEKLLCAVRQGRAQRPEADRRGACGQIAWDDGRPASEQLAGRCCSGRDRPQKDSHFETRRKFGPMDTYIRTVIFLSRVAGVLAALL